MNIFKNVDSTMYISGDIQFSCISDTWIFPFTHVIPIYLVCPDTMDKIAPPERTKGLDPKCKERIKSALDKFIDIAYKIDDPSEVERRLEEPYTILKGCTTTYRADGVFIARDLNIDLPKDVEIPAIFICPERIYESSENISKRLGISVDAAFKALLRSTIIHEQNHAFTWKRSDGISYSRYNEDHIRILEEFSAQVTAYSHLDDLSKIIFTERSKDQPIEYNTWKIVIPDDLLSREIAFLLADCYRGKPSQLVLLEVLDDLLWISRRRRLFRYRLFHESVFYRL